MNTPSRVAAPIPSLLYADHLDFITTSAGRVVVDELGAPRTAAFAASLEQAIDPVARWVEKANAYVAGAQARLGATPGVHHVLLALSVAQHETWCGDAWAGEHNWGAVQRRTPSPAERAILATVGKPNPANVAAARSALADAVATGVVPPIDHAALHVDSSPVYGWYWVFFWAFPDDAEGASLFAKILAADRPTDRRVLDLSSSLPIDLSTTMYQTHYYEGVHNPHEANGAALNISDYARAISAILPGVARSLASAGWAPGGVRPDPVFDLTTVVGVQAALASLGFDVGPIDGVAGPRTVAAIKAFQTRSGLVADGVVGPLTSAKLRVELARLPSIK